MAYMDERILQSRKELERQEHTTLETGIYVNDELITFIRRTLPDSNIEMYLPTPFIPMPEQVKAMKYPSKEAPDLIFTSLDSTVNLSLNILVLVLEDGDTAALCSQFQTAIQNVHPMVKTEKQPDAITEQGNEVNSFEFTGYALDGQSYNCVYLVRLKRTVLHGMFQCPLKDKGQWKEIINKCVLSVRESN